MKRLRVALDQNFPVPIVAALQKSIIEVELEHVTSIDRHLARVDDDELVRLLWLREWDLLVTCDHHMLDVPRVLATILQTKMSVVAAAGQGDDSVAASGLLLAHLPHIAHTPGRARSMRWQGPTADRPSRARARAPQARTPTASRPRAPRTLPRGAQTRT